MTDENQHNKKQWKKAQKRASGGIDIYIGKTELEELVEEGVLDLDEPIEYSVSAGASDGRGRAFLGIRNADPEDESG